MFRFPADRLPVFIILMFSMINLAMLTALGRSHEVAVHVRGAKNNGLTNDQIMEVFLQTAVYCGVPAAVDSFREATKVLADYDEK